MRARGERERERERERADYECASVYIIIIIIIILPCSLVFILFLPGARRVNNVRDTPTTRGRNAKEGNALLIPAVGFLFCFSIASIL
jgi:heme/copper-type cytochrome/quinol oxidase subunit 2